MDQGHSSLIAAAELESPRPAPPAIPRPDPHPEPADDLAAATIAALHRLAAVDAPQVAALWSAGSSRRVREAGRRLGSVTAASTATWADVARVAEQARPHGDLARTPAELLAGETIAHLRSANVTAARAVLVDGLRFLTGSADRAGALAALQLYAGRPRAARRLLARASTDAGTGTTERAHLAGLARILEAAAACLPGTGEPTRAAELYRAGRWDDALAAAQRAEARLGGETQTTGPVIATVHRTVAAEILRHRGHLDLATDWLQLGTGVPLLAHLRHWSLAGIHGARGDLAAAVAAAARARSTARGERAPATLPAVLARQLRLALAAGRLGTAHDALDRLLRLSRQRGQWLDEGPAVEFECLLGRARIHDDAVAAGTALELARAGGRPLDLARACTATSGCADLDRVALLHEAVEVYTALGATHSRAVVAAQLRALGARTAREQQGPDGLTATERLLVGLLATGHTNRTIAAVLARSEKRIEAMVAALCARTGTVGRIGLARHVQGADAGR